MSRVLLRFRRRAASSRRGQPASVGRRQALVTAALLALCGASPALAEPAPKTGKDKAAPAGAEFFAEVLVLHATNAKKGIDPRIGSMPELEKPPFSSYDSYALLDRARLPLDKAAPSSLKLPDGRTLIAKLLEVLGPDSVRLGASINQPNGKDFLPVLEVKAKRDQAFIVAGQSFKKGILVLVIKVVR